MSSWSKSMNKLIPLVKYGIINSLGVNRFLKNKKRGSKAPIVLFGVLAVVLFFVSFGYMFIYGKLFQEGGAPGGILLLAISLGSILVAMTSITNTNAYLFNPKDYDMLMSMPLKTRTIFLSKAIDFLILNYVTLFYFYVPAMIVYSFFNDVGVYYFVSSILTFIALPLLPISVFGFISFLFGFIKIDERAKKLIKSLFYISFTVLIFIGTFSMTSNSDQLTFFTDMLDKLKNVYYPGFFAFSGIEGEVWKFVVFFFGSFLVFFLFMLFASRTYTSQSAKNQNTYIHHDKVKIKTSSKVKALFLKEIKGYFSVPIYVGNTIIGPLLSTIGTVFMLLRSKADYVEFGSGSLVEMTTLLPFVLIMISCYVISLSPTTPSSMSLEGKNMWILKSSPIQYKDIKNSKLFVNYLICIPFIVINVIILLVWKRLNWYSYLFVLIVPILVVLISTKLGLFINLMKVRLDFDNPAKVIKQSMPVLLTMIFSFLVISNGVGIGLGVYLATKMEIAGYLSLVLVFMVFYVIITVLLNNVGEKLFNKIVC